MKNIIDKTLVVEAVISKIKNEGAPEKIESKDLKDYDTPIKIPQKGNKDEYTPDIAVHYKDELNLFEIELEDKMYPEKWKTMSLFSKQHKGYLYLVVPDYLKEKIKNEMKKNQIVAGLIYFNTK